MSSPDTPRFAGWHRPGRAQAWRKVTEAESEVACWDWLLAHGPHGGDTCVLPALRHPGDPPTPVRGLFGGDRGGRWPVWGRVLR